VTKKKPDKQPSYLAVGEFDGGQVVNAARGYFLWTIQKEIPLVSTHLRDEVLKKFVVTKRQAVGLVSSVVIADQRLRTVVEGSIELQGIEGLKKDFQSGRFDHDQAFSAFLYAFFDWTKHWNLDADWLIFRALKTLNSWSKHKVFRENLQWSSLLYGIDDPENEPQPPKGFPVWNVLDESAQTYRLKITNQARNRIVQDEVLSQIEASHREHFIRQLEPVVKDYQERISEFYKALGYKPVNRLELLKHIEWAVAFQVSGESFRGIAGSADVEPQAVSKAVKSVLSLIGLNQRLTQIGRPPGARDSGTRRVVRRKAVR
jgi:hypothetical protein